MALGPPGTEEGGQGHLGVGALVRAGAAADLAADHQGAQAALGGVVVRGHFRFGHEDEEFPVSSTGQALEVLVDAPAQLALNRQRVVQAGTAEGQQAFFQGQLGGAPLFPRSVAGSVAGSVAEGRSLAIDPMHGVGPLGQLLISRVECAQVMDLPQQSLPPTPIGGGPSSAAWGRHSDGRRRRSR